MAGRDGRPAMMSGVSAAWRALLIVAYFALATVWLPDKLLQLGPIVRADAAIQDLSASGTWLIGLGVGLWLLRGAQRRGWI